MFLEHARRVGRLARVNRWLGVAPSKAQPHLFQVKALYFPVISWEQDILQAPAAMGQTASSTMPSLP